MTTIENNEQQNVQTNPQENQNQINYEQRIKELEEKLAQQNQQPQKKPDRPGYEQKLCKNGQYRYYKIPNEEQKQKTQERIKKQTERLNNYVQEKKTKNKQEIKKQELEKKQKELQELDLIKQLTNDISELKNKFTQPTPQTQQSQIVPENPIIQTPPMRPQGSPPLKQSQIQQPKIQSQQPVQKKKYIGSNLFFMQ